MPAQPSRSEARAVADEMLEAISLAEISYGNGIEGTWAKRQAAAAVFSQAGYNVLYYIPNYNWFLRDPNLFVLGRTGSNSITILFTGTEVADNPYDIVQDLKTSAFADDPNESFYYIPNGHAGFRAGIANLIEQGFFADIGTLESLRTRRCTDEQGNFAVAPQDVSLADFICRYRIRAGDDPIEVTIIGHSLGAGLAQMSLGVFSGLRWMNGQVQRDPDWPLLVRRMYAFAPPLALYTRYERTCDPLSEEENPINVYNRFGLVDISHQVIRDGDVVPAAWNPVRNMHCVVGEHFGHYYRIPRSGNTVHYEGIGQELWRLDRPHASRSYEAAIRRWRDSPAVGESSRR